MTKKQIIKDFGIDVLLTNETINKEQYDYMSGVCYKVVQASLTVKETSGTKEALYFISSKLNQLGLILEEGYGLVDAENIIYEMIETHNQNVLNRTRVS